MSKTLVLTEKPSVAKDIARVLGCKKNGNGCIIGDKYIVTWALGHLVTLADPEGYDAKYKTWRMDDLPMLPEKMKLKLIILDAQDTAPPPKPPRYFISEGHIDHWVYSPPACPRRIETVVGE